MKYAFLCIEVAGQIGSFILMLTRQSKTQFTFPDPEEPSLVDMVSHNIDTDEYFTYSRQQKIQIAGSVGTALIMQIYNNPQYKEDCMTAMAGILSAIASKCGFQDDDLITDLIAIDQSLQFVDAARKKNVDDNCWSLVYGASMLIMACTEKVLRLVYKHDKDSWAYSSFSLLPIHN